MHNVTCSNDTTSKAEGKTSEFYAIAEYSPNSEGETMREYFVMAPLIIMANGEEEAGCIARKQLDEAGFKYGLMGKGTEIKQSTVEITGVQSSEGSP